MRSAAAGIAAAVLMTTASAQTAPATDGIRSSAEEAIIYGLPMSMYYKIMNQYAIDDSGQFKAPFNTIANEPKVYTPADTAIVTPNSDTPYSLRYWTCARSRWCCACRRWIRTATIRSC